MAARPVSQRAGGGGSWPLPGRSARPLSAEGCLDTPPSLQTAAAKVGEPSRDGVAGYIYIQREREREREREKGGGGGGGWGRTGDLVVDSMRLSCSGSRMESIRYIQVSFYYY